MTASGPNSHATRFVALEQADFQRLEHAGYLKGLLQPFKGKGSLETWASQCAALRDDVIGLAQRRVPSSTSCGNSPNFSSAARAAAFFAAKSSRVVPE